MIYSRYSAIQNTGQFNKYEKKEKIQINFHVRYTISRQ